VKKEAHATPTAPTTMPDDCMWVIYKATALSANEPFRAAPTISQSQRAGV